MARRKSLNRRLSRYSRNSTGSAFLDPDTANLGDEQPYWWKNLENNTVMRPSMSYNTPNQTSSILDPNSRVDSGQLQDGWWKVLETTDIADDAKLTTPTRKPDADNNTDTTLESDEEPRIIKRKVTLRQAARKSQGNPFVNFSDSETSDENNAVESPMNKSGSIDKATTSSKRVNKISESSSSQTNSTDAVLKLKPTLFKKRHKDRQQNIFDDVLKENELLTPKRRKSLKVLSHSKTGSLMENKIPITESPIVKHGGIRKLVLSFENDPDLSRLPNPEAQSTLLESSSSMHGSNKDNSDMEAGVLKPKSTFLKRRKRGPDKNVFADVFAEEEAHNDVEISKWKEKGIDASAEASKTSSVGQAGGSIRGSQSTPSNVVNEIRTGYAIATKESRSTEAISPSAQDPRGPVESNASTQASIALTQASIASSDTSDKNQDPNIFLKPRSTFLKRSRKRPETNIFQEILEEDDNVDAVKQSRSDALIDRTKEDLAMKNQATVSRGTRKRGSIDQESNTDSEELRLALAGSSEEDGNNAKESSELYRSTGSDIEISELGSELKEKRQRRSALHVSPEIPEMSNRRTANLSRIINEVSKSGGGGTWNVSHREARSDVDALERSRSDTLIDRTKEDLVMKNQATVARETRSRATIDQESNTGSEKLHLEPAGFSEEDGNNAKESSKLYRSTGSDIEVSEQGSEPTEKRQRRSALHVSPENRRTANLPRIINEVSKSGGSGTWNVRHRESVSDVDVSVTSKHEKSNHTKSHSRNQHERDVLKENKGSSHKLYTQLSIDTSDDSDQESKVIERTRRKGTTKLGKTSFRSTVDDSEPDDLQNTPSRPSKKLRTSISQSNVVTHRDADLEPVLSTPKRQSKSLSKSQKLLRSRVISEDEMEDVQATPKRQSRNSSGSQKLSSSRVLSEAETEDIQEAPKRQSKSLSKSQKLLRSRVISEDEMEDVQATPKRQSRNSSGSQKLLSSRVLSEAEPEDVQGAPKRQSKNLSKSQKLLRSRVISEDEMEDVQATPKRQSRNSSGSQKLSSSRVLSEAETEDVQEAPKRQSKSLSKSQKLLSSRVMSESETEDVQQTTKRQTRSLSKSQKLLSSRVMSESETEDVQQTTKRQTRSLSKSQKMLSSRVMSESETKEVQATPKRQSKSLSKSQKLLHSRDISEDEAEDVQATPKRQSKRLSKSQKLLHSRDISEDEAEDVQATPKKQSKNLSKSQKLLSSPVISKSEAKDVQATPKRQSKSLSKSPKLLRSRVISEDEAEEVPATSKRQSKSLSKSQKLLSSPDMSEDEAKDVQATPKRQSKNISKSQKLLSSLVTSEDEAEEIQSTRKTKESKSVAKAQKRSTLNAIKELEAQDPNILERRSKVLSKLPNDISSAANQIEPCEIDDEAKRQSKSISMVERQSSLRILGVSEAEEVEITRQKDSRNFMSREPSVSPAHGESQLTVPITGESNIHSVQEEEEEEGGIDEGAKSFSTTGTSEQRIAFTPNVTKDREDEDLLNPSSKNAKEAEEVSRKDTGRNVGKNHSVALGIAKGSVGSTRTSTNRAKDSSRSQRNIEDFLILREAVPASQVFADKEKAEKFKRELEKIKKQAMDDMKLSGNSHKSKLPLLQKKPSNLVKTANAAQKKRPAKPIDKAFLVNGQVYKVPRLPRPKYWVTDRLYKYLWKQLEPKYTLQTRVTSEKFVQQLSNVTSFIVKQKSYTSYKAELYALMKEMARLGIISTRYEFYTFCHEFFPYELRIKVVPMLLPGNKRNIPYEKNKLNEPLLRS